MRLPVPDAEEVARSQALCPEAVGSAPSDEPGCRAHSGASFLAPIPDAEGIRQTKEIYLRKFARELSDEEAYEILGRVMRYLFLMNNPCYDTDSIPENLTTTSR